MVNKGYPEGLRLIVKKCKTRNVLDRYAAITYTSIRGRSLQLFELNFAAVFPHRRHNVESHRKGAPPVFE